MRPRVALNAQLLRLNQGYRSAGISQYIFNLLRALAAAEPEFELHTFCSEQNLETVLPGRRIHSTRLPAHRPLGRIAWEQIVFPLELARGGFDLVHSLAYVSPLLNRVASVVTVYDTSFMLYPQYFRPLNRIYLNWGLRSSLKRARRIIAISQSTRDDLVRLFHLAPAQIDVIAPGVDSQFFAKVDANAVQAFRQAHHLPDHFVLFIGTLEPRKNIPGLIRAFARVKRKCNLPHSLVIAGGRGWKDDDVARAVNEMGLEHEILFPGFVPRAELPDWYRAADVFVYPSYYEGFGMPALEALATGAPVITSNVSSLPEAVGDAALLVDPSSVEELTEALARVLSDRALIADLRERGPAHARAFTWSRAVEQTLQTYRRALGRLPEAE